MTKREVTALLKKYPEIHGLSLYVKRYPSWKGLDIGACAHVVIEGVFVFLHLKK